MIFIYSIFFIILFVVFFYLITKLHTIEKKIHLIAITYEGLLRKYYKVNENKDNESKK